MENDDYLDIDGRQLNIVLAIYRAGSLSGAARRLDMNQSTVSYWLDIMRKKTGDPLFVRSGNGVAPTDRAQSLIPVINETLMQLQTVVASDHYVPADDTTTLRIACTSVERTAVIKPLLQTVLQRAPGVSLDLQPLRAASSAVADLREGLVDFVVSPQRALSGEGIMQRGLFKFADSVFFDPAFPLAPGNLDAFCNRGHVRISLSADAGYPIDQRLAKLGKSRRCVLQVSDFDSALQLIRNTPLVATLPAQLLAAAVPGIASVPPPWEQEEKTMFLHWHARHNNTPWHKYWRQVLIEVTRAAD